MFGLYNISRSVKYVPLLTCQRWKVQILPKEKYKDDESPLPEFQTKPKVKTFATNFYAMVHRKDLTWAHFRNWRKWRKVKEMRQDQTYNPERHKVLGPDLATSHFITIRGGKVKFIGSDTWITKEHVQEQKIPNFYVPGFLVEEVDASETNLCYEGFDNLSNLSRLKKLIISNCPYIDDWCLGRSHLFANTLEYLDISGCQQVTERGICTLHALKKLKTLIINDTPNIQNKELACFLLQDIIPECEIVGVNYKDPVLMKRIERFLT